MITEIEVDVRLTKNGTKVGFHEGQNFVWENKGRFNVVNCGRRWGKTSLGKIIIASFLEGKKIGYFWPNSGKYVNAYYNFANDLKELIDAKIVSAAKRDKIFRCGKGYLQFFSLEDKDAGRGLELDIAVYDECAFARWFEHNWTKVVRATLADSKGSAWFLSTPNGVYNYFYTLSKKKTKGWKYFHQPTWKNPNIDAEEIEEIKEDLPDSVFNQEYAAEFVDTTGEKFFYAFNNSFICDTEINLLEPLYLSFDFNINPTTCVVGQKIAALHHEGGGCFIHREHEVIGGTREICQELKQYIDHPAGLIITGDVSGSRSDTLADTGVNNYDIIKQELGAHNFINTTGHNPMHQYSSNVCNSAFHMNVIRINPICESLIKQLTLAQQDRLGKLVKDRDKHKNDLADGYRYLNNAWFLEGVPEIRDFKNLIYA